MTVEQQPYMALSLDFTKGCWHIRTGVVLFAHDQDVKLSVCRLTIITKQGGYAVYCATPAIELSENGATTLRYFLMAIII